MLTVIRMRPPTPWSAAALYLLAVYGLSDCDARKAEGKARGVGKAGWRKARKASKARETCQACEARRAQGTQGTQGTQGGRAGRSGRVRG